MKKLMMWMVSHTGHFVSAMALFTALASVSNTCIFDAYQPEVPEELK